MKIEIKSRFTGQIIASGEWGTLRDCVMQNKSNLRGAYLRDADLRDADLRGANLGDAYLGGADLRDADLRDADLGDVYLGGAYLGGADLRDADLGGIKKYKNSHDIFVEIIRRQDISVFTAIEWQAIAVITIHRICWDKIKKQFGGVMGGIFQKLADIGFSEWLEHWKTIEPVQAGEGKE